MREWLPLWLGPWALKWAALLALPLGIALLFGMPHVLVSWKGDEPVPGFINYRVCDYLGPFGLWRAWPGRDVYEECPAFVLREW